MLQFFYVSKKVVNFEENMVSNFVKGMIKKSKTEDMLLFFLRVQKWSFYNLKLAFQVNFQMSIFKLKTKKKKNPKTS